MAADALRRFWRFGTTAAENSHGAVAFKLTRYFIVTSLIALAVVTPPMYISEHSEEVFFQDVQKEQVSFIVNVQAEFMRAYEATARDDLLKMHEASHVSLSHVFSNMLWDDELSPLLAKARSVPIDHCRAPTDREKAADIAAQSAAKQACFAKVGQMIMSFSRFPELDAKVRATMRNSTVFKIKVFDLRGITVYSSEHKQIGEDKSDNYGWKMAARGRSASELTHRDQFSTFESVVENRDLISSYIPMLTSDNKVIGVFEIYSDVTPFLKSIQVASAMMADRAANNRETIESVAKNNQDRLNSNNRESQIIGGGLLALFYVVLLLIVHIGQRILDIQARAQEHANDREMQWHREKMTALATMAANVSHEVGNPLATISALALDMQAEKTMRGCAVCQPKSILEQTDRILSMTRQIVDFATVRSETFEPVDVNQMVKAVCDFLSFDHRFRAIHIEFRMGDRLPARVVIPDHLNEALMYLLQGCLESSLRKHVFERRLLVETVARDDDVLIRISCNSGPSVPAEPLVNQFPDSRFELARRRLMDMGGRLTVTGAAIEVTLPSAQIGVAVT